jgi:hypothetical protein
VLRNPKSHPRQNSWYALEEMQPRIVHFLGTDVGTYPYQQEMIRLRLVELNRWPVWLATVWSKLTFSFPWLIRTAAKNVLRPIYHAAFGPRKMQASARV